MSETTTKTAKRTAEQITEANVDLVLRQLARIPHYRYVATAVAKQHIVSSLRAAVEEVAQRIKTPREAFSLSAALLVPPMKESREPELPDEPIASQADWDAAKAGSAI